MQVSLGLPGDGYSFPLEGKKETVPDERPNEMFIQSARYFTVANNWKVRSHMWKFSSKQRVIWNNILSSVLVKLKTNFKFF